MSLDKEDRYDAWNLGYGGGVAAVLPGILWAALGIGPMLVGLCIGAGLASSFRSIRCGLRELVWYRWYLATVTISTMAFGALAYFEPALKALSGVIWAIAAISVNIAFLEQFGAIHGQKIGGQR